MKQMIIGGYRDELDNSVTRYNTVAGGYTWDFAATADNRRQVVSTPGTLSNLYFELATAPGAGRSYTFTLMKGDNPTSLVVTISGTDTTGRDVDPLHAVSVVAGDTINIRCVPSGTPTEAKARWSIIFEGSNANESLILGMALSYHMATRYAPVSHGANFNCATETETYQIIPTNGVIKNLYVALDIAPGGANAYRLTLRKNGESSALVVTITGDDKTGNNIADEIAVAPGDYINMMIEPLESPPVVVCWWGFTFVADTDGESLILGQSAYSPPTEVTKYHALSSTQNDDFWVTTESTIYQGGQSGPTLKNLYVRLAGTASGDKVFKIRATGGDTGISVTISLYDTTGSDIINTYDVGDYDDLSFSCYLPGPSVTWPVWGLVCYIPPVAPTPAAGGSMASKLMAAKLMGARLL